MSCHIMSDRSSLFFVDWAWAHGDAVNIKVQRHATKPGARCTADRHERRRGQPRGTPNREEEQNTAIGARECMVLPAHAARTYVPG